jgi:hypothetical protein
MDSLKIGIANCSKRKLTIIRALTTATNDTTLIKNFRFKETQNIQFRLGLFNVFNQAFVTQQGDINLTLQTSCNAVVQAVPNGVGGTVGNVCDPTKGYTFTDTTKNQFGSIITKRGNRRVLLSFRYTF